MPQLCGDKPVDTLKCLACGKDIVTQRPHDAGFNRLKRSKSSVNLDSADATAADAAADKVEAPVKFKRKLK